MMRVAQLLAVLLLATVAAAQQNPNVAKGFSADKTYDFTDVEAVNLFNGSITLSIPVGQAYAVGPSVSYRFSVTYSGNNWQQESNVWYTTDGNGYLTERREANYFDAYDLYKRSTSIQVGLGWRFAMDEIRPGGGVTYVRPDGSEVVFYQALGMVPMNTPDANPNVYYANDGSYLRARTNVPCSVANPATTCKAVDLPDGTSRIFAADGQLIEIRDSLPTDAQGEPQHWVRYARTAGPDSDTNLLQVTDSLGRSHQFTLKRMASVGRSAVPEPPAPGNNLGSTAEADHYWVMTEAKIAAFGGTVATYKFEYLDPDPSNATLDAAMISRRYATSQDCRVPITTRVPLLTKVELPDGLSYEMTYDRGNLTAFSDPDLTTGLEQEGVRDIAIRNGGSGYTTAPAVTFSGGGGAGATGVANISAGAVTGIQITNNGAGYTTAPAVTVAPSPNGSVATATAFLCGREKSFSGNITRLQLPTKGDIEWQYRMWNFPPEWKGILCPSGTGVPGPCAALPRNSEGVATRLAHAADTAHTVVSKRTYSSAVAGPIATLQYKTLISTVSDYLDPNGAATTTTKHYYTAATYADTATGAVVGEYGLPFTRALTDPDPVTSAAVPSRDPNAPAGAGRYLSTKTLDANGVVKQYTYLSYEADDATMQPETNRRVKDESVVSLDNSSPPKALYVATERSDFDRLGHYRVTKTSSNIPSTPARVSTTSYSSSAVLGLSGTAAYDPVAASLPWPWFTGAYSSTSAVENGATVKAEFCFDKQLMTRKRAIRDTQAGARGDDDVVVTFAYDAKGKVTNEYYYGGDRTAGEAGAGTQALCTLSQLGALDYQLTHKPWSPATNDFTETSTYAGTGFLVRDMTVDRNTGAVASTRDASGVQTTYTYDVMGRLTSVRPAGRAWSTYRYPTPTDPTLEVNQAPGGVPSTTTPKSTYEFDGLGRLTRETTAMPAGQTSFRKTEYDGLGRRKSVSELLAVGATTPYPGTAFTYDYAGRVLTTTAADGALTSFSYDGPAKKTRTSKIWTGGTGDTAVTTTEEYDGYGRLVAVTEKSGPTSSLNRIGADVRTEYGYDGADHLVSVIMNRTAAGPVQRRTFDYDGRGFLRWESQPESGMTSYKYDARGHVLEIRRGAADTQFDLNYKYDAAERMTRVEGRNPDFAVGDPETNRFRVIKQFEFGTANAGADKRLGKLTRATRYNYLWYGPVRIVHAYEYTDTAGRTTRRTTTIDASAQTSGAFTTDITLGMNYDEFDQTTSMEYPMCTLCGGPASFPTRSNVVWAYNRGRFQTLSSFIAGTTYWPNGLRKDLLHSNGITDTQTAGAMPRPTQLKFDLHDRCVIPAISVQPVSTSVASAGGTATLSVSVSGTGPFQYAWMSGGNVVGTTPTVTVTVNATSNYYVEVTGPCGFVDSNTAKVTVASCATPETGMVTAAPQPDRSWILTARPVARQNATYEWRRLSDNQVVGTLTTLNVAALSVSTTYAFTVTDSCGTTTSNVTVSVPLAITTTGLVATAINNATQIAVSWPAVSGATTYVVQRRAGAEWTEVGRPTATTFTDTTVVAAKTYAYRVYAIGNSSAQSGFSNSDVATTSVITPPLAGNTITATSVNGMLAVVNGVRATAGWPAVTWSNILASTDPVPNPGAGILGRHITSCRARMNEALQALGVPVQDYTDADLRNVAMKALHVAEIEQRAQ